MSVRFLFNFFTRSLLLYAVLFAGTAHAQPLPLETYTPANGLVDTRITKTFQDSRGRMFFLTREGFSVFDGQRFEYYTSVNGIPVELCNEAVENADHSVSIYNFKGDIFYYTGHGLRADTSYRRLLTEITYVLPLPNDEQLVITNYHLYLKKNNRYTQLAMQWPGKTHIYADQVIPYRNYIIFNRWAATEKKEIILYDFRQQKIKDVLTVTGTGIISGKPGSAVYVNDGGWQMIDTTLLLQGKLKLRPLPFRAWLPANAGNSYMQFDNDGNTWLVNTTTGCTRIDPRTGEQQAFGEFNGVVAGVTSVMQDIEKNYWFIAPGTGVQKLQQSALSRVRELGGRALDYVYNVYPVEGNEIAVHTNNRLQLGNGRVFPVNNSAPIYWQHETWQFKDLFHLVSSSGKTITWHSSEALTLPTVQVSAFYTEDRKGRLVISGRALIVIDAQRRVYAKRLPYYADNIITDEQDNYWCFMRNNQLAQVQWQGDSLVIRNTFETPALDPRFAAIWQPGMFAVATRKRGLIFLKVTGNSCAETGQITREQGLSNNFVYTLLKRKPNELLLGTAGGLDLVSISGKDTIVQRVSASSNIFTGFSSLAPAKDNIIYARSEDGMLYRLNNSEWRTSGFRPQLQFKAVSVNGEDQPWQTQHRFLYTRNNFRFSVTCPTFLDNRNTRFSFLLTGRGRSWQQTGAAADYEINNLAPGSYSLSVTVNYPGRIYASETIDYHFTILPPFWKRWWFILGVVLIILAGSWLLVRSYLRRKLEKQRAAFEQQQAVERERTRIATDMHDDLGAGLSRIKFISEKMLLQHRSNEALQPELEKISGYSDEMAEKMGEIVWALNQRYDTLGDLVAFCRSYASEYLEPHGVRLYFEDHIEERTLKGETRRNLFLVLKEALHNTVKHSGADTVRILFRTEKNGLHIRVSDNGKGLGKDIRPFANGLENMKKRVAECGGELLFTNEPGLAISISIPLEEE